MPVETVIVVCAVVTAFTFFGILVFWASRVTDEVLREKAMRRER